MKKKSRLKILLTVGLGITGAIAISIPTLTLTSCASSANVYLSKFTLANNSNLKYAWKAEVSSPTQPSTPPVNPRAVDNIDLINPTFEINYTSDSTGTPKLTPAGSSIVIDQESITNKFNSIKKTLKIDNIQFDTKFKKDHATEYEQIKSEVILKQNYLNIYTSTTEIIKNFYNKLFNLVLTKTSNSSLIFDKSNTVTKSFSNDLINGIQGDNFYANIWLNRAKFDLAIKDVPLPCTDVTEIYKKDKAVSVPLTIANLQLEYNWLQRLSDGTSQLSQESLNSNNITNKNYIINLSDAISTLYFNSSVASYDKDKTYFTSGSLYLPSDGIEFKLTNKTNARAKSTKIIQLINQYGSHKTISNSDFDNLLASIGYCDTATDDKIPTINNDFINGYKQKGIDWIKGILGLSVITANGSFK